MHTARARAIGLALLSCLAATALAAPAQAKIVKRVKPKTGNWTSFNLSGSPDSMRHPWLHTTMRVVKTKKVVTVKKRKKVIRGYAIKSLKAPVIETCSTPGVPGKFTRTVTVRVPKFALTKKYNDYKGAGNKIQSWWIRSRAVKHHSTGETRTMKVLGSYGQLSTHSKLGVRVRDTSVGGGSTTCTGNVSSGMKPAGTKDPTVFK